MREMQLESGRGGRPSECHVVGLVSLYWFKHVRNSGLARQSDRPLPQTVLRSSVILVLPLPPLEDALNAILAQYFVCGWCLIAGERREQHHNTPSARNGKP